MEAIQNLNITISGLIGAGKTTLANSLSELLSWSIIGESVEDNPYLDLFYEDMEKYAFSMQIYFLNHRFGQEQKNIWNKNNTIQDRSMWEDIIFANMLYKTGKISEIDYNTYKQLYSNMINFIKKPSLIVYLDVEPEIALERIKLRNRSCENNITLDYLKDLRDNYEEWLNTISKTTRVIRIDWNKFINTENVIDMIF
jgi:deoxyadenosine kinase